MALTKVDLRDSEKLVFGTGDDLEIWHDGSNSYISDTGTGSLKIRGDVVEISAPNAEQMILATADAGVNLYYNSSKKFETTDIGVQATGHIFSTTKFRGNDDVKVSLGTSEDLQLYHDGSDSWIRDTGTGRLLIDGSEVHIRKYGAAETMAKFIEDGAVELYYNNSKKLETTDTGIKIDGGYHEMIGDVFFNNADHAGKDIKWDQSEKHLRFSKFFVLKLSVFELWL